MEVYKYMDNQETRVTTAYFDVLLVMYVDMLCFLSVFMCLTVALNM